MGEAVELGWRVIWRTLGEHPELVWLLAGLAVALSGLSAVVGFASIYATQEIGFTLEGTVKLFVCLQVAAAVGALASGPWQDRVGSRWVLLSSLGLWVLVSVAAFYSRSVESFYGEAGLEFKPDLKAKASGMRRRLMAEVVEKVENRVRGGQIRMQEVWAAVAGEETAQESMLEYINGFKGVAWIRCLSSTRRHEIGRRMGLKEKLSEKLGVKIRRLAFR